MKILQTQGFSAVFGTYRTPHWLVWAKHEKGIVMSYVTKVLAPDEKLIGIARLHWIYVLKGLVWFLALAGSGWLINSAINHFVMFLAGASGASTLPVGLLMLGDGAMYFLMAGGFLIFFLFVLKVLVTEIGLSTRRILHKEGFLFVKMNQIDLEEVRGENLDMGWFGRILGYGYLMLDCRFIGDVKLPAMENPERFLRALHDRRAKTQDALSVVLGKGNGAPVKMAIANEQPDTPQPKQPQPEIQPSQPGGPHPEVHPDQPGVQPEIPTQPTPHSPPPPPAQPPAPTPPPGQPTTTQSAALDPAVVAEVVKQVMPQMAQQVAHQLVEDGVIEDHAHENDNHIDRDLIDSFDDAAIDPDGPPRDNNNKLEHAMH